MPFSVCNANAAEQTNTLLMTLTLVSSTVVKEQEDADAGDDEVSI